MPLQTSESVRGTDRSTQPASGSQAIESLVMTKITSYLRPVTGFGLSLAICALGGCASPGDAVGSDSRSRETAATIEMHPFQVDDGFMAPRSGRDPDTLPPAIDFAPGAVTFVGTAVAEIIDSRRFDPPVAKRPPYKGRQIRPAKMLPKHSRDKTLPRTPPNDLRAGGLNGTSRIEPEAAFPGITQSPWRPPDPSIAVGVGHVVETVNMEIAWYRKDGTPEFQQRLDSSGDPGFLESVGAGGFTFDPKCFYDSYVDRYVMIALEVYGDDREAWITMAVSDDGDPNGLWFKYRMWALVASGEREYWVDFPGFGFDDRGWYVTGNLFALAGGDGPGFLGSIVRSIDKTGPLAGEPVVWNDRVVNGASYQVAHAPDAGDEVCFVRSSGQTRLEIARIDEPFGPDPWTTDDVAVPEFSSGGTAVTPIGPGLWVVDARIWQAYRRQDRLVASHAIKSSGSEDVVARWYEVDLGGTPVLEMSGEIRLGDGEYTIFPSIAINGNGAIGMIYGRTSLVNHPSIEIAGRIPEDAAGTMSVGRDAVAGLTSPNDGTDLQRWGDYFDCTVDPTDDLTFWAVGEIQTEAGWQTEIFSFRVGVPADFNRDGRVDGQDLGILLLEFGGPGIADLNGDGIVTGVDLGLFLADW